MPPAARFVLRFVAVPGVAAGKAMAAIAMVALAMAAPAMAAEAAPYAPPLPERLSDTGLYIAGTVSAGAGEPAPGVLAYTPQYPLWSDGAAKQRWLYLPPGTAIDASNPDAWQFPVGTKLWKEFGHGRAIETRYIERLADGTWRFASYVWRESGDDADLAAAEGVPHLPVAGAPGGRYGIPSRDDCLACHEGGATPVIGVSALQLSPDRDPNVPHAEAPRPGDVDLAVLNESGLLAGLPGALLDTPPKIAAVSATERSALGYLHANCGHCHNAAGPLGLLDLVLAQRVDAAASRAEVLASIVERPSDFETAGAATRVTPGNPQASVLALRMHTRNPLAQMPPLGTSIADVEGAALIEQWIREDLITGEEYLHELQAQQR
ncbi:MAG TPA: hypothetical protein VFY03_01725 [Woeseiaceae bacterium]|nr:hypothetical protein [Woeseiaceae bacterium]